MLYALVERGQEILTKKELFERVWGGMAVSDDALTSCIQELRNVLGDNARRPSIIETRHRRGYRLMVPVGSITQRTAVSQARAIPRLVGRAAELAAACARLR